MRRLEKVRLCDIYAIRGLGLLLRELSFRLDPVRRQILAYPFLGMRRLGKVRIRDRYDIRGLGLLLRLIRRILDKQMQLHPLEQLALAFSSTFSVSKLMMLSIERESQLER
jgi:hypothetical protein